MAPIVRSLLAASLLLSASASASGIKLGCLSAAPLNSTALTSDSTVGSVDICVAECAAANYTYAFYTLPTNSSTTPNVKAACSCSNVTASSDTYVFARDTQANCEEGSTAFIALPDSKLNSTTTSCPYIGPGSRTTFTNYTYISLLPTPLDCIAACNLSSSSSTSTGASGITHITEISAGRGRVALLSPSSADIAENGSSWACACAEGMGQESYTTPCGQASWYAVEVTGLPQEQGKSAEVKRRGRAMGEVPVRALRRSRQ